MTITLDATTIITEANAAAVTTASYTVAAGDACALLVACNGVSGTDHTITITGTHSYTQRFTISDTSGQPGVAYGATSHNSAGVTATTTVTRNTFPGNDTGISTTITRASGVETSFTGATGTSNSASGSPTVTITATTTGSYVFGTASDWAAAGAFTAGTGETLDNTHTVAGGYNGGQWHSTNTVSAGSYTSDGAGSSSRQYNCGALELVPAAGAAPLIRPVNINQSVNRAASF